jgi:hypothetical protein
MSRRCGRGVSFVRWTCQVTCLLQLKGNEWTQRLELMYDHPLYRAVADKEGNPELMPRVAADTGQDPVIDSYKAYAEFLKHRQHQLYWSEVVREDEASRPKYKPNWCEPCAACDAG